MGEKRSKDTSLEDGLSGSSSYSPADSSRRTTPTAADTDAGSQPEPQPPAPQEEERGDKDIDSLVARLEGERDEYLELARRTKADFENYRKRMDREAAQAEARGRAAIVRQLLPVLDNLERALAAAEPKDHALGSNHIAEGIRLVYEELAGILTNAGVETYEPAGERFDPDWHEAMMTREVGAEEAGKVVEVLQKGYRLNGQVLRPARVVVGSENQAADPQADRRVSGGTTEE
jgi:molecular chaperone GrpE